MLKSYLTLQCLRLMILGDMLPLNTGKNNYKVVAFSNEEDVSDTAASAHKNKKYSSQRPW